MLKVAPVFIHSSEKRNVWDSDEGLVWITHTRFKINGIEFSEKKILKLVNHLPSSNKVVLTLVCK